MDGQVTAVLSRAGVPTSRIVRVDPLGGGTYNALHGVELQGGERLVLKTPPPASSRRMRYEAGLLLGEAQFYRCAAEAGVPAPRVLHAEPEEGQGREPFVLMSHVAGVPWQACAPGMSEPERAALREELGTLVARLHAVRGPGFGYPAQSTGPLADRWPAAFAAMTGALLQDAEDYRPWLPCTLSDVKGALALAAPALAEVAAPALVHFDLWPGNILIDGDEGSRTITGVIDGERMFWGDPLADFASLSLFMPDAESDEAFLTGYAAGGGRAGLDAAATRRLGLYRAYLYLIMLIETVPRGYSGEHLEWRKDFVGPRLLAALSAATG